MQLIPGLLIAVLTALLSLLIAPLFPSLGATTLAIFIGMLLGNTLFTHKKFQKGFQFAETNLLSFSIVLLGGTLSATTLLELGLNGILFIILQMTVTIVFALWIGKRLGFGQNFSMLMAAGNAVCGSSAIAATAPAIHADETDKGIAITVVNLTGVILMLLLPVLTATLYDHELVKTSAMMGGTLQSVGQVVASGAMVSEPVKDLAMLFKIVRVIFLVGVVIVLGLLKQRSTEPTECSTKGKIRVPWYVLGFFGTCILFTVGLLPQGVSSLFKTTSHYLELIALGAIGLRVNFRHLISQGISVSLYGLLVGTVQILAALLLINILF
ncbi:MAG: YeiH family protein [Cellulosilyticaceae bacterium]